jgi:glycerol-3-phosphate dehydrogenase (NAD(P)+)
MSGSGSGTIGVVGAGAWGTALAVASARAGKRVVLWARDVAQAEAMARERENRAKLPGVRLDEAITPTSRLDPLERARMLLIAVPAQAVRGVCEALATVVKEPLAAIVCAKGIERETKAFMSDIVKETLPRTSPAILSGPSFAQDVAQGLPTAVVIAAADAALAGELAAALSSRSLRLYHTTDMRGVEIGGAAKNVLAIAAGIVEGRRARLRGASPFCWRARRQARDLDGAFGARRFDALDLDAEVAQFRARSRARRRRGARGRGAWQACRRRFHGKCSLRNGTPRCYPHAGERLRGGDPRPEALDRGSRGRAHESSRKVGGMSGSAPKLSLACASAAISSPSPKE